MRSLRTLLAAAVSLVVAASAAAQSEVKVGSTAPAIDVSEWVKGGQTTLQTGRVYVVEFWATWCVPCRKSIPHLTKLQQTYSDDLTIIGVSDEKADVVRPFVQRMSSQMDYVVAVDNNANTKRNWLEAAKKDSIPTAFIVDRESKVVWIGNPLDDSFDSVVSRVVAGRYNPTLDRQTAPMLKSAENARRLRNWTEASAYYTKVMAADAKVYAPVGLDIFEMYLIDKKDPVAAYALADGFITAYAKDGAFLRSLAEKIAADPKIPQAERNFDMAKKAAQAARTALGENDTRGMATLAMVHYHAGEIDQAIELQKRAYFLAAPKSKEEYRRALNKYQDAQARASS